MTTVPVVDVGQPVQWTEPFSTIVNFHEFESLDSTKDVRIESPPFQLHGHSWTVRLYPGGEKTAKDGYVSCCLKFKEETPTPITTKYSLSVSKMNKTYAGQRAFPGTWGFPNFVQKRKRVEKGLDDGSLTVKVTLQIRIPKQKVRSAPQKAELHLDMMRLLRSKRGADVVFDFGNGETLHAHSQLLLARAPVLAEFVRGERPTTVPIQKMSYRTFKPFLEFVYAESATLPNTLAEAKEMLQVANRFGVIKLKLAMESHLVNKHLTYESATDLLILADSCSCALLREEAMTVAAKHVKKLMRTDSWSLLKRNTDLFAEMVEHSHGDPKRDDELANLSVGQIYEELYALGATPIDGTRKILVQKLLELREEQNSQDENSGE